MGYKGPELLKAVGDGQLDIAEMAASNVAGDAPVLGLTTGCLGPLWYGIFVILMVQLANITPSIGFNLFLVTGLAERSIGFIFRSVLPFITIMVFFAFLITVFPEIVLFLPNMLGK